MHQAHFDCSYASAYAARIQRIVPFYEGMTRAVVESITHCSGDPIRVIELGCGNGHIIEQLFAAGATEVVAVDYSETVLDYVKERFAQRLGKSFFDARGDINDDSLWDAAVMQEPADLIVASLIFHDIHSDRRADFFANVASALRPGGLLCFADPLDTGVELEYKVASWIKSMDLDSHELAELHEDDPMMFTPITRRELHTLAEQAGLEPLGRTWDHLHFAVELFGKKLAAPTYSAMPESLQASL